MPSTTYNDIDLDVASIQERTDVAEDVSGEELRLYAALLGPGVYPFGAFKVAPGSGLSVDVGQESGVDVAVVPGTSPGQGNYVVRLRGTVPHNITLQAADLSNPRIDEIYVVIADNNYDLGGVSLPRLARRTGDPASSPSAPGPDSSWTAYLKLVTISVSAGASSVTSGNLTDPAPMVGGALEPTGTIKMHAGGPIPAGYLECNGAAVSRTTHAGLFNQIGTIWGAGNGSTTFNVPDLRGRVPRGVASSGTGSAVGQLFGADTHTHTGPSHTHSGPSHSHSNPSTGSAGSHAHSQGNTGSAGSHVHAINFSGSVGTLFHSDSGFNRHNGTTGNHMSSEGSHTHSNPNTNSGGAHTHSVGSTGSAGTGQTGAGGTGNTGSASTIQAGAAVLMLIKT